MGTSTSAAHLAGKMNKIATGIPKATKTGVAASSLAGKNTIIRVAASRGVYTSSRIAGGKWSVRYDLKGTRRVTSLLRIRGPFQLVEGPTAAHTIPRARTRSKKRKQALAFNGVVRKTVQHPGTSGKYIFRDSKKIIEKQTLPIIRTQIVLEMSQALN